MTQRVSRCDHLSTVVFNLFFICGPVAGCKPAYRPVDKEIIRRITGNKRLLGRGNGVRQGKLGGWKQKPNPAHSLKVWEKTVGCGKFAWGNKD